MKFNLLVAQGSTIHLCILHSRSTKYSAQTLRTATVAFIPDSEDPVIRSVREKHLRAAIDLHVAASAQLLTMEEAWKNFAEAHKDVAELVMKEPNVLTRGDLNG
jgi:hypothetical protein